MATTNDHYHGYGVSQPPPMGGQGMYSRPFSFQFYRDPTVIAYVTIFLLLCNVGTDFVASVVDGMEAIVLRNIRDNAYPDDETQQAAAENSDIRGAVSALLQLMIGIPCGIVFLVWNYRVCKNAHCLSPIPLTIKPGWAVGTYFIPIANLFYPYMGLSEAFRASSPSEVPVKGGGLLLTWWWIHIIGNFLGNISFRMAMRGGDDPPINYLLIQNGFSLASDIIGIFLNTLTIVVVWAFLDRQRQAVRRLMNVVPPPPSQQDYTSPNYFAGSGYPPTEYQSFGH